jgi:A118 family predicted phage portal protein
MGLFSRLAGRLKSMFFHNNSSEIGRAFGVELISSTQMRSAIENWDKISSGSPPWLSHADDIRTINMAQHIADTRAKLTTLDIGVAVSGSARADFIQAVVDNLIEQLPKKITQADALGGMVFRWNGASWDFALPGEFGITEKEQDDQITGIIFASHTTQGTNHYTRLEYHRFNKDGQYIITNKAFRNRTSTANNYTLGQPVPLTTVSKWAHLQDEVTINGIERPLYAFYRVPGANTVDSSSPLGLSVFAKALTELRSIDIAYSRKDTEIEDSKHITFVGQTVTQNADNRGVKLPRFVQALGISIEDGANKAVHEHSPTLLTDNRIKDINFDLSLAGVKSGFSEGVFVLDGQSGMITATQVEADDRDTIQTIKDDRDALRNAIEQAIYGVDVMATLYNLAPMGAYEATYNFGDITYNYEEDRGRWYQYAMQGKVPFYTYLVKFEGLSEEEAKALIAEAQAENAEPGLFDDRE